MKTKEVKLIVKIHNANHKKIVVITDSNLIGKKFEEKKLQLDLTSDFYKGEEMSALKIKDIIPTAYIVNITGRHSIAFAQQERIIDANSRIITIAKVPHTQIMFAG